MSQIIKYSIFFAGFVLLVIASDLSVSIFNSWKNASHLCDKFSSGITEQEALTSEDHKVVLIEKGKTDGQPWVATYTYPFYWECKVQFDDTNKISKAKVNFTLF